MADYTISLGVTLDESSISSIKGKINGIKPDDIKIRIDDSYIDSQINSIKSKIQSLNNVKINLGTGSRTGNTGVNKVVNDMNWAYKQMLNIRKRANSLSIKMSGLDASKNVKEINELSSQINQLKGDYQSLKSIFGSQLTPIQLGNLTAELDETTAKIAVLEAKLSDAKNNFAKKIQLKLETGEFSNQINKIESDANKLSNVSDGIKNDIADINSALNRMNVAASSGDIDGLIKANQDYERSLKNVKNQLDINTRAEKDAAAQQRLVNDRSAFQSKIDTWLTKNSAATKKFGAAMLQLRAQAESCDRITLDNLHAQFSLIDAEAGKAGLKMQSLGDRIKTQFQKYSQYFSVASVIMWTTQGMKDMFQQVIAVDTAMTELKKVTNETDASYGKFLSNAAQRSKELGTTVDGLVSSTADFARLGYDFEQSAGLAEVANIYAVVGDEIDGVEGATQSLVSTMAAFKDEMNGMSDSDFAMSIVDKFNEVSNNFAISSGGIGEALQRSASSMAAANNTLDETIALTTAANEVVQNPEKVGNALKTISMRIRGAKTELEEAGESTDGMAESTASLRAEMLALSGVDIMENDNTFKSTYKIMDELSQKWESLSDIQRATITELVAGKHQGNVMSSLMANFDTARDALETSLNSSGSALEEHAKWSDSLEAHLNKLKSTWQSLSLTFMKSDFLKGGISLLTGFIDVIDKSIDKIGVLPTLFTGFTLFNSLFNKNSIFNVFKTLNTDLDGFTNKIGFLSKSFAEISNAFNFGRTGSGGFKDYFRGLKSVGNLFSFNTLSKSDLSSIQAYNDLIDQCVGSQTAWYQTMQNASPAAQNLVAGANGGKVAMQGLTAATNASRIAMIGASIAATAMNAAISMGISALISWGIKELNEHIETADELSERIKNVTDNYKSQHNELMKLKGDYDVSAEDSMISKYGELSKGVGFLGENISLTADEYAEYQNIVSKIANTNPDLIAGYNSQGDAILKNAGNVEALAQSYRDLIKEQDKEVLNTGGDILKDFQNDLNSKEVFKGDIAGNLEAFNNLLSAENESIESAVNALSGEQAMQISRMLEEYGVERDVLGSGKAGYEDYRQHIIRAAKEDVSKVKGVLDEASTDLNAYAENLGTVTEAYLSTAFLGGNQDLEHKIDDYSHLSEKMQSVISQSMSGLGSDFYAPFLEMDDPYKALTDYYNSVLSAFDNMSKSDAAQFEAAFDLKTKFNGGDISYGEYVAGIQEAGKLVDDLGLNDEIENQIKLSLGLNEEGFIDQYQNLLNRLTSKEGSPTGNILGLDVDEAEKLLNSLSSQELSVLTKIIPELDANSTREQIQAAIDREMVLSGLVFDLNLEVEVTGIESLNTALSESVTASGLSSESIAALKGRYAELESQGWDLSSMFEETSHGIHLNRNELSKFENELSKQKLDKVNSDLDRMKSEYDKLGEAIKNATGAEKEELFNKRKSLAQKIADAATLASQYQGLTSAYNDWLAAEEAGNERDMYENVISGFETVKDELSRGWADDSTVEFLEMITGRTDLASKSGKELKEVYNGLGKSIKYLNEEGKVLEDTGYSVKDFFTVDDDGNSTSKGVYNFLDAIGKLEEEAFGGKDIVKRDSKKNIIGFDFKLAGGDKAIADALGISEELVQIMVRAADDAGFVVSMDGTYKQLADLQNEARASADYLKEIGKTDFEFDFNTSNVTDLKNQLAEAEKIWKNKDFWNKDGTFNFDANGATEAMQVVSTLQAKVDKLSQEKYGIGLTVEDREFEEPLENLQEYGRTIATLNQLELNPVTNAEDIETCKERLDELAQGFNDLPDEKKVEIGLTGETDNIALTQEYLDGLPDEKKIELGYVDENGNPLTDVTDVIQNKIESGGVKIPTILDVQANMDKNIEDLKDIMLLGILDENSAEAKRIRVKFGLEVEPEVTNPESINDVVDNAVNTSTSSENTHGGRSGTFEVRPKVEVNPEPEVKEEGFFGKIFNGIKSFFGNGKGNAETGASGQLTYRQGVKLEPEVDTSGAKEKIDEKASEAIDSQSGETETVEKNVNLELNVDDNINNLSSVIDSEALEDVNVSVTANVTGLDKVNSLKDALLSIKDKVVNILVKGAEAAAKAVNSVKDALNSIKDKKVRVKADESGGSQAEPKDKIAKVDYKLGTQEKAADKDALVNYMLGEQALPSPKSTLVNYKRGYQEPPISMVAQVNYIKGGAVTGTAGANWASGTAFNTGNAFARGNWSIGGNGIALGGELGQELVVRDGRFFTIGDNGAEFFRHKKNDIVFNAAQTESLFKYGGIKGANPRGKVYASGTAFAEGNAFPGGSAGIGGGMQQPKTIVVHKNSVTGKEYTKTENNGNGAEEFSETIDLIEIALDRIERKIESFENTANNIYKKWTERNTGLINQIDAVGKSIELHQKAYNKYMEAAEGVGLSSSWEKKIKNGKIDFEAIDDEALKQQIDDYRELYEKALDCQKAIEELKETESELYAQRVENVATRYEGMLGVIEHEKNMLEEYINQSEEQSWIVSAKYYNALEKNERETIAELEKQKAEMLEEFNVAMDSGTIDEGSEAYYELVSSIDEVTLSIEESNTKLLEYQQTLQQLSWEVFDLLQEKISAVTNEIDFLIDLMSNKKLYDDNGRLTDEGNATMGLHGVAYNTYMHQADQAAAEAERLKNELAEDPYDTELEERYREMIELQQDYILNAESEKDAIKKLVEEGIQLEIEALEERIDKYNESLNSAKDLYEYNKKVKEQTEEIASLEKQLSAYDGFTDEETMAKVQQIKVDLESARAELEETEYDKYIDDTEKLLDNLLIEYEEFYNARLDNIDALISDMITEINTDAGIIGDTIRESADSVGYTLSDSMKTIWNENESSTKNVITTYGDKFVNAQTTTNNALTAINTNLQNMIAQLNKKAATNVKTASTSSVAKSSDANKTKTTTENTTTKKSSGDGTPKIGDRVKFVSGQYYYDSQGKKPLGSHKQGEYVYITNINTRDWATHGYHISTGNKLGKGDLGWLKLNQISGYATGAKRILSDELAWTQEGGKTEFIVRPSDGAILTPVSRGDKVFSASASNNLWNMANSPAEFIKDNLNLGAASVPSNSTIQSNYTQHLDKVIFNLPNVKNYDEFLSAMQRDKNFERLIQSMTINQIAGGSALAKGKSIR